MSNFDWTENQTVPGVAVNPGTGPVHNTTVERARENMDALARDAGLTDYKIEGDGATEGDGRYTFYIVVDGDQCEVDMPGLPLDEVRYRGEPGQSIIDYPRLYVGGSSWVWQYAQGIVARRFGEGSDDEEG